MKRDFEVIRKILTYMEDLTRPVGIGGEYDELLSEFGVDVRTLAFHVNLLLDAKYIDAEVEPAKGTCAITFRRLTWGGCEFIEAAKNDSIWHKAKDMLKNQLASYPLSALQTLMNKLIMDMVI